MTTQDRVAPVERASLGDTIVCRVKHPRMDSVSMRVDSEAALSRANELLAARCGWTVVKQADLRACCPTSAGKPHAVNCPEHPLGRHCQNGGDVCLAGNADGVCCPEESCDIEDGSRRI